MKVAVLMGSTSDEAKMEPARATLERFGIEVDWNVMSAHRTPERVAEFTKAARASGYGVIICGAGKAAHLAGAVAANSTLPVIGVPIAAGKLGGLDALLSTVQMPTGIPVATVAVARWRADCSVTGASGIGVCVPSGAVSVNSGLKVSRST